VVAEKSTGRDGVDKTEVDKIRLSLNIHSLDSISHVSQSNGEVFISFFEHSLRFSHEKMGNKLLSSNSKVSSTGQDNDAKLKLQMGSYNIVDSSFLPPENARNQQDSLYYSFCSRISKWKWYTKCLYSLKSLQQWRLDSLYYSFCSRISKWKWYTKRLYSLKSLQQWRLFPVLLQH